MTFVFHLNVATQRSVGIFLTFGLCVIFFHAFAQVGNTNTQDKQWRRTSAGWEFANALDVQDAEPGLKAISTLEFPSAATYRELEFWNHFHRGMLAAALACLIGSFSSYLLLCLPNRAIEANGT